MSGKLVFRAGATAWNEIRTHGFDPARIGSLIGASGGAKWLVLSQLDRVVATEILPRLSGPVATMGTSIGAWRFACYAQADPVAAIERFEERYIHQTYSEKPDRREITDTSSAILDTVIGAGGVEEIVSHPVLRMNVLVNRARHFLGSEVTPVLASGLLAAALGNAVSRRWLGLFFERALFHDPRDPSPFRQLDGFPLQEVPLSAENLKPAILATGSIPLVLEGVRSIPGARSGVYRDGGIIDYHLDIPHSADDRLALYLHFYDFIKPGWFDKPLSWRRPDPANVANTLLVSPSQEFVSSLPYGKIPDRHDFEKLAPDERVAAWSEAVARCRDLADELNDVLAKDELAARLERW